MFLKFKITVQRHNNSIIIETKTYSEQILEPSQVYEVHTILKAHIENMIFYFIQYLCILCIHSTLVESGY
jgi:hypothetical protein